MRTTLDIDEDVLQAAKELARIEKTTVGHLISQLARKGLTQGADLRSVELVDGIPVLPQRGIVTNEMIERLDEQADLEDAGLLSGE